MGLILRRNGLNVRVDGLQRRGASGDGCCCENPVSCGSCSAYTVTTSAVTDDPTDGTRGYITDLSLDTPSNSNLACLLDAIKSTLYGTFVGWRQLSPGVFAFSRTKTISLTVCGLTFERVSIQGLCNTNGKISWSINFFDLFLTTEFRIGIGTGTIAPNATDLANTQTVGTCCDFTVESATGTTPCNLLRNHPVDPDESESVGGSITFSVTAGPC